jgi:hypothetical protein
VLSLTSNTVEAAPVFRGVIFSLSNPNAIYGEVQGYLSTTGPTTSPPESFGAGVFLGECVCATTTNV